MSVIRQHLLLLFSAIIAAAPLRAAADDIRFAFAPDASFHSDTHEPAAPFLTEISFPDTAFVAARFDESTAPAIMLFETEYSALSDMKAGGALGIRIKDVNWGNFIYGFTYPAIQKIDAIIEVLEEAATAAPGEDSGDITENLVLDAVMFIVILIAGTVFFLKSRGPGRPTAGTFRRSV